MAPWLRFLEAYLVQALLRTPAFHRFVEKAARGVHRIRHGIPPEEMGGTKVDGQSNESFLKHFAEEIQTQLGRAETKTGDAAMKSARQDTVAARAEGGKGGTQAAEQVEDESADAVWQNAQRNATEPPKQGFMGEYMGALREQLRGGK